MDFLANRYKNNNVYENLYSGYDSVKKEEQYIPEKEIIPDKKEKIKELEEKIKIAKKEIKSQILESEIEAEPFFDEQFLKDLEILNNFFASYIPNFPKYYVDGKINPRAFLDAKDLLENEFPISTDEVLYSSNNETGVMKPDKYNFENGFTVDADGNVYNSDRNIIYNHNFQNEKIKFLDLLNNKLVTENGIRIELPKNFLEDFLVEPSETLKDFKITKNNIINKQKIYNKQNDYINPKMIKDKIYKIREKAIKYPKDIENLLNFNDTFGSYYGYPISYDEKYLIELPVDNLYMSDIFYNLDKINFGEEIRQFNTTSKELGVCNFKDIPYGELSSTLLWGGGEVGVKPLSSSVLTDKDIIFTKNGTAKYSNSSSSVSIRRNGCSEKRYKTGHVCMWTPQNKMGLKRSIIQYIYGFCSMLGLFNANIPRLLGFKKIKIFGGICIGGLLERALCKWQERLSSRINELFQCVPAPLNTDLTKSGFENATFPHGASLDTIGELDNLKSVKFGDRFVVNKVPTNITGERQLACGVFSFDPNQKLKKYCPWSYKGVWSGKPFNSKDNFQSVTEYNNVFNNPLVQDVYANQNNLGEDSITRKLMSLLYAFVKKQILVEAENIGTSMESVVESSLYEAFENMTSDIAKFEYLNSQFPDNIEKVSKKERDEKYKEFFEYFNPLVKLYGFRIPEKIKKTQQIEVEKEKTVWHTWMASNSGNEHHSRRKVKYTEKTNIDIEVYSDQNDKTKFLIPKKENISYYDAIMFAHKNTPSPELKTSLAKNLEYLAKTDINLAKKYRNVRTIRDYLLITETYDSFQDQLKIATEYASYDLNMGGYSKASFEQCIKRINSFLDDVSIVDFIGGKYV